MIRTIDFNNLATGENVTNQYEDIGVRVSATSTPPGKDQAMIFDSNAPTGGDTDLGTDNLDNVLIISEDGDATAPNDNETGGAFTFKFDDPVSIKSLTFLDIEGGARLLFYGADGSLLSEQWVAPTGDNGQSVVQLFVPGTVRFEVEMEGTGAIDNLVFDDPKAVDPVEPVDPTGDGIVSGDDTDNTIDLAYTGDPEGDRVDAGDAVLAGEAPDDDIIDANCGDDTISAGAGDDDVYAGGGDDVVSGGAGDDLIYGDSTAAGETSGSAERESFNWSEAGFVDGEAVTDFTQNTGTVKVTYSNVKPTPKFVTSFSEDEQNTTNVDGGTETVSSTSSLSSEGFLSDQQTLYALGFNTPVSNVEFNINDIDGDSVVRVQAFDAAGAPVGVMLVGGDGLTLLDTDGVPGVDTADSNGGYADAPNPFYSMTVNIAGPVSRIEITHEQDGPDNTSVNITDVFFTPGEAGAICEEGDDNLSGDEGDDTIFGEGGDDTLLGGVGADILSGGDGNDDIDGGVGDDELDGGAGDDTITGGDGSDTVTGGSGDDLIDTSGNTPLPDIGYPGVFPADADPEDDRDSVDGGDGNDTIRTGDDRDTINGGAGDDVINSGIDDDIVDGGDGNDRIVGAEGNDSILGGDGNDTIYANNDPELGLDFLEIEDDGSNPLGPDLRPGNGRDTVDGGAGDDLIYGGDDDDLLIGGSGDDVLDGGIDDDILQGGMGNDLLIGGQGNDTMTGGDDRDTFVDVNAGDIVDGSEGGDDFDVLDLSGSAPEEGSLRVTLSPDNVENGVVDYFNADGSDAGQLVFTNIERVVPCFTPGTLIATPKGERKVEELEVGDRIITRDNGMQVIRWIGKRDMSGEELAAKEHLRPVLIRQGALGNDLPERDMMVSPQHRVLIANDKTALYFEEREVLVAAKHLTDMEGIDVVDVSHTTYIHIMFDQHEVILSDGTWTESFQPGDMSLAGVGDASREEILELFPELATRAGIEAYAAARKSLKKHEAKLVIKNS